MGIQRVAAGGHAPGHPGSPFPALHCLVPNRHPLRSPQYVPVFHKLEYEGKSFVVLQEKIKYNLDAVLHREKKTYVGRGKSSFIN
eukprot:76696-Pelagomonas_calceolata.AAC.3